MKKIINVGILFEESENRKVKVQKHESMEAWKWKYEIMKVKVWKWKYECESMNVKVWKWKY